MACCFAVLSVGMCGLPCQARVCSWGCEGTTARLPETAAATDSAAPPARGRSAPSGSASGDKVVMNYKNTRTTDWKLHTHYWIPPEAHYDYFTTSFPSQFMRIDREYNFFIHLYSPRMIRVHPPVGLCYVLTINTCIYWVVTVSTGLLFTYIPTRQIVLQKTFTEKRKLQGKQ